MDAKLFQLLADSLKQAAAISSGTAQPAKVFASKKSPSIDNKALATKVASAKKKHRIFEIGSTKNVTSAGNEVNPRIDARAVRERTGLSQSDFAVVMNVSVKTLQNWEQHRREPTGPAEALLKIVSKVPQVALEALHS